jgi:hypothetical protein
MDVPVLFIIFNKPDTTAKVFKAIAAAKPTKLFIAADGPRSDQPGEIERCAVTRAIVQKIDWPCEVKLNFSETNLGCGRHPASAITWTFEHVDRAIILEDDCVPHSTFFRFCGELLDKYLDCPEIMHVGGNNYLMGKKLTKHSYFFSSHILCAGGWATWRRAWKDYDIHIRQWPLFRETNLLKEALDHPAAIGYFRDTFDRLYLSTTESMDVWDYQWSFLCWTKGGLAILPNSTLVSNIGFGHPYATHTSCASDSLALLTGSLKLRGMKFPLDHPSAIKKSIESDRFITEKVLVPIRERPRGVSSPGKESVHRVFSSAPFLAQPQSLFRTRLANDEGVVIAKLLGRNVETPHRI